MWAYHVRYFLGFFVVFWGFLCFCFVGIVCLLVFGDGFSEWQPGCSGTHFVDQRSACVCLLSAEIKDMHYHAWFIFLYKPGLQHSKDLVLFVSILGRKSFWSYLPHQLLYIPKHWKGGASIPSDQILALWKEHRGHPRSCRTVSKHHTIAANKLKKPSPLTLYRRANSVAALAWYMLTVW